MKATRRHHLAAIGGAVLAAGALSSVGAHDEHDAHEPDVLYGHGLVWNRDLPGEAGEVKLAFDMRVNLETGAGFGTAGDPVHPDWNVHFAIESTERRRLRRGGTRYTMRGVVTEASNPSSLGLPVRILAETHGEATAIAIALGDVAFAGAGLVVIAIIAILIPLLLPAVRKLP
jgi:hypothetical protein